MTKVTSAGGLQAALSVRQVMPQQTKPEPVGLGCLRYRIHRKESVMLSLLINGLNLSVLGLVTLSTGFISLFAGL